MSGEGSNQHGAGSPDSAREIVRAYFRALETGLLADVPYAEDATFRAPLTVDGSGAPLVGRDEILAFFRTIVPRIVRVEVTAIIAEGEWAAGAAVLSLDTPAGAEIRTMNLFRISEGCIREQENHFDPRAALGASS